MNISAWVKWVEACPTPKNQHEANVNTVPVYLCSHEWPGPNWIPALLEWKVMLKRLGDRVAGAGLVLDQEACARALSAWFWRYHWRELDRELFKQYAIAMAAHFNGDISALMNGVWDEVLKDSEGKENLPEGVPEECFKPSPVLWRHLMNVCEIPGCRIRSKEP